MREYRYIRVCDIIKRVNDDLYLPAIQREFVWDTDRIERLFDSLMADFPIGSFLWWIVEEQNRDLWPVYEFTRDFNEETPHNRLVTSMHGITRDITLVLDGQQRINALFIGLKGTFTYFYYRQRQTSLYLNLLKPPTPNEDDPEELTYGFQFREKDQPENAESELWYKVGQILDDEDAEDAKERMKSKLCGLSDDQRTNAHKLIGRLHNRVHTMSVGNYYKETSQDYDKVVQIFVRANSAGKPLAYSDILLSTATAKWEHLDAREAINGLTDRLNEIMPGGKFGKDFVLKACLYLSDLPIQYKIKNFTKGNLRIIEGNWENIKKFLSTTAQLMSRFGFNAKNIVAPVALLPIAYYIMKRGNVSFHQSSDCEDADAQTAIHKWFIISMLKKAFGGSSDTTLLRLRRELEHSTTGPFPAEQLHRSLDIQPQLNESEIDHILEYPYQGQYTMLALSLLYPDRYWKDTLWHEDHIFPQSEFKRPKLKKRGYSEERIKCYMNKFNLLPNLQLLTDKENFSKNAQPFDQWIRTRDPKYRTTHSIPDTDCTFDSFEQFFTERSDLIKQSLRHLLT